ncbi:MAG: sulfurtransferase [Bradymonadaceae bacterium]|nr:sulfurtransferase [Lujinxingiaceae bacterium]
MNRQHWQGKFKHTALYLLVTLLSFSFVAACGEPEGEERTVTAKVFLEIDDFEYLRGQGALVLDARGASNFTDGHVPGAVNAAWKAFVYPDKNGIVLDSAADLQVAARSLGINNDQTVLIYGDGGKGDSAAGRLFWTLEYIGHPSVYLLNGGIEAYKKANLTTEAGTTTAATGTFTVKLRPEIRATQAEVLAASQNGTLKLIDSRTDAEYDGDLEDAVRRGNTVAGHIPQAVHYHWEDVISADGVLRPKAEIRAELLALGINETSLTIPYCQSGVRSGFLYAVLQWLEFPAAKNYDGSWWEWSRTEGLPIEDRHEVEVVVEN